MYLLFDCNNFFASCEQVFRPDWRRRPLVVLSNNDGCVISRSPEAKAMGIQMGEPYFKCRERLERARAVVCSANFALYGDLSARMISILEESLPNVEQYSIDEAFSFSDDGHDWLPLCKEVRRRILRWTGLTVSTGIAPTRTLAKLANETAKHDARLNGVLALTEPDTWQPLLQKTPVGEVWGVGRRLTPRMKAMGIITAAQLAQADLARLRAAFGVHGERLALELRGISCLDTVEGAEENRTQVMVTRTLQEGIQELEPLRDSLCRFVEKAGRILRSEGLMASSLYVILRTSRYEDAGSLYATEAGCNLPAPTDDTRVFSHAAGELLQQIYRPGYPYRKVGVMLANLQSADSVQPTFDAPDAAPSPLMQVLDSLQQQGHNVHFANHSDRTFWNKAYVTQPYTTSWDHLPEAR